MNRRAFFATIAAGLAASADSERLLWVPGRKLISIPSTPRVRAFSLQDLFTIGDVVTFGTNPVLYRVTGLFSSGRTQVSLKVLSLLEQPALVRRVIHSHRFDPARLPA